MGIVISIWFVTSVERGQRKKKRGHGTSESPDERKGKDSASRTFKVSIHLRGRINNV